MARSSVAIRLATEGKAQVQRDFADIADVGGAHAARLRAKWESETSQIERMTDRAAKTAERLAAVSATPMQQRIGAATGIGATDNGAAAASAKALAQELDRAEREAQQLVAAIDPLFAAQSRYTTQVARINDLKRLGVLTEERYQQLLSAEETALDAATRAQLRHGQAAGTTRAGMQQLSFQIGDISQQLALGVRGSVIFAQQSGQVIQALQLMGGQGNAFLKFLGGPWGIALASAAVVLTPLIGKILATKDSIGDLIKKMEEEAEKTDLGRRAKDLYRQSEEGVAAAVRDRNAAMKESVEAEKSQADRDNLLAQTAMNLAIATREKTKAYLEEALAQERVAKIRAGAPGQRGELGTLGAELASNRVAQLEAELTKNQTAITEAQALLSSSRIELADQAAKLATDPAAAINKTYKDLADAAKKAAGEVKNLTLAQANDLSTKLAGIETQRLAAIKELEASKRTNSGGTAIFDAQIGSYFDTAAKYRGMSEHGDRGVLEAFFREANIALDPEKTAWCAAFVNAVLATNGVKGTGSLAASSFLNFGKDDTKSPQRGDIVVVKSSGSPSGQHVGFLDSIDAKGNVKVLAGNTGDKVASGTFGKGDVLAIRRPPTPSEAAKAGETLADKSLRQQNDFEEQRARLNEQLLAALGEQVAGYQAQSDATALQAHADHETLALKIQNNLEEGKYGEATSETAKARAAELIAINDAVEKQKLANQALQDRLHDAQQADRIAANDNAYRIEGLEYQDEIARTASEHRDVQLQILDLVYQEKLRHLEYLKAQADLVGNTEEAARIQAEINRLPEQKERDQDRTNRNTMSPGEAYLASLPKTMADLNNALQQIEVGGLEDLNKQLTEAVMSADSLGDLFGSLGDIFHNVSKQIMEELINLAIQMFIMRPLAEALFGGGSAGASGGSSSGSWISAIGSALGAIFGGSGAAGGGAGAGSQGFVGPPSAVGTHYFGGGLTWVGEHGKELVSLPRGSRITPASESRRLAAANDSGPTLSLTNYNDFRGADASSVAAIQQRLDQMEADLPARVVGAYQDARARFVIR